MVNMEQLDFFKHANDKSAKSDVGISLPAELKEDIMAVAKHYEISANTVVVKCIQLALESNIDFSLTDTDKTNKSSARLSLALKGSTASEIRKIAREHKISVSTLVHICVQYVFSKSWRQLRETGISDTEKKELVEKIKKLEIANSSILKAISDITKENYKKPSENHLAVFVKPEDMKLIEKDGLTFIFRVTTNLADGSVSYSTTSA